MKIPDRPHCRPDLLPLSRSQNVYSSLDDRESLARPPMRYRDASSSKCPRHHQREFFLPERATMRPISLIHDDIRMCAAQCVRPSSCVPEEERLLRASDKVCARERTRHNSWRPVAAARRSAKDRTKDAWMPKTNREGQLSTRRGAEHCGTFRGQRHTKPQLRPSANVLDEELIVCRKALRRKAR
jgi:hypothetical protein